MNPDDTCHSDDIPLDILLQANQRCEALEEAWKTGSSPRLEDFLGDLPIQAHPKLLCDFLLVEWEYRCRRGEEPLWTEYANRFPTIDRVWFQQALTNPSMTCADAAVDIQENMQGKVIADYVLLEQIGSGGMGIVWKAKHRHMDRIVALKTLSADVARDDQLQQRFRREMKAAAKLTHDNIVTAYDAGEHQGVAYLVMEYVNGVDLACFVRDNGPCSIEQTIAYVLQAARGLGFAHDNGIVHRDVKPGNLLVDSAGVLKVLDLGLARLRMDESPLQTDGHTTTTSSHHILGTPNFMAPEQADDAHMADHRADIYSLGCTMFFLATGKHLFAGGSHVDILRAHQRQPATSLRSVVPDASVELDRIFQKMVAKKPDDRYASMRDVIADLDLLRDTHRSDTRKRRLFLAGGVVVVLAVLVLVAWILVARFIPPRQAQITFSHKEAQELQTAWARYLNTSVVIQPESIQSDMKLVLIPPGRFLMGTNEQELQTLKGLQDFNYADERLLTELPRHEVHITRPFRISPTEVTVGQFREFIQHTKAMGKRYKTVAEERGMGYGKRNGEWHLLPGCHWANSGDFPVRDDSPVGNLAREDVLAFCHWLSERTHKTCRLPTEAEWEYVCRAGNGGRWCFGDDDKNHLNRYAWYAGNASDPHPVATKRPNAFGIYDMHGNVRELCQDWFAAYGTSLPAVTKDPQGGPEHIHCVLRGGSFQSRWARTRSAARDFAEPSSLAFGFRVVMETR